ncbi:hypothetical protein Rctr71_101 [Virus Rctr71]|nr:hypothetical protein Rctr71_101 [Virus Rctr71]
MATALLIRDVDGQRTIVADIDLADTDKVALPADAEIIRRDTVDRLYNASGLTEAQVLTMLDLADTREQQ